MWSKLLPWAEYWYNTSFHSSLGMTPFHVVYGREPPSLVKYELSTTDPPALQEIMQERDVVLSQLKSNLLKAQTCMKKYADKKRRQVEFNIGDMVLVKLQPYRQHSLTLRQNQKLGMRYFGPFPVIERIGLVAYKLQLPPTAKIHPVFHVSLLKLCHGSHKDAYLPLPLTTTEQGPQVLPKAILQHRLLLRKGQQVPKVLVQWDGFPKEEASWEDWVPLQTSFPSLNLEDKVVVNGGSIVMPNTKNTKEASITTELGEVVGHVSPDLHNQGIRKSSRVRIPNRKYSSSGL